MEGRSFVESAMQSRSGNMWLPYIRMVQVACALAFVWAVESSLSRTQSAQQEASGRAARRAVRPDESQALASGPITLAEFYVWYGRKTAGTMWTDSRFS